MAVLYKRFPHNGNRLGPPVVESGKALAYRLRGTTADMRAAEATNGVPTIQAPFTDGQRCALYRVTRAQLKQARERGKDAGNKSPAPRDILRDRQLTDLIDELGRVAHALHKALYHDNGHVTPGIVADAIWSLDDAATELSKLRG